MVQFNALDVHTKQPSGLLIAPVVFVVSTFADGSVIRGSGSIVGKNDILTAQHVIKKNGQLATSIKVFPYHNLDRVEGVEIAAGEVRTFSQTAELSDGRILPGDGQANTYVGAEIDLAIIGTKTSLWEYGFLWPDTDHVPSSGNGFPEEGVLQGYPLSAGEEMVTYYLPVRMNPVDNLYDLSGTGAGRGVSGGPLWGSGSVGFHGEVLGVLSTVNGVAAATKRFALDIESWMNKNDYLVDNAGLVHLGRPEHETIVGTAGADQLNGGGGSDTIYGGADSDVIVAGVSGYGDYLDGGDGNDRIVGNWGADTIIAGSGTDWVYADEGNDWIAPGSGNDTINGSSGTDTVSYATLGQVPNGTVYVDLGAHVHGVMTIMVNGRPTITQDLWYIENVVGSDLNPNHIIGDNGANILRGGANVRNELEGRDGNDVLYGGNLSDVLRGQFGNDTIFGGQGEDTLFLSGQKSAFTFQWNVDGGLVAQAYGYTDLIYDVERFEFTDGSFSFDQIRPTTPQPPPPGTTWTTSTSTTMAFGLTNMTAVGSGNVNITGNFLNNEIKGNSGRNVLKGGDGFDNIWGMLGNDTLYGGSGMDSFIFSKKPGKNNVDRIMDYKVKDDEIWLDNAVFKKVGAGSYTKPKLLNSKYFTVGEKAKDKNDYVIYNKKTGALLYDADGTGNASAVKFATLSKNLKMTHYDFFVI